MLKLKAKIYSVIICLFFSTGLISQDFVKLDSMYSKIDWNIDRQELLDRMLDEVVKLRETDDLNTAKVLLDSIISIAEVSDSVEFQHARCFIDAAIIARKQGKDDLMVSYYQEAIDIYKGLKATVHDSMQVVLIKNISICYNNSAQVFLNKKNFELALDFYRNAVGSVRPLQDSLSLSIGYYNMSTTFVDLDLHDSALHYIMLSKELEEGMKSSEGLAYAHEGLAHVFNANEEYTKALIHIDSALYFLGFFGDEFFDLDVKSLKAEILANISSNEGAIEVLELSVIKANKIGYKKFEIETYKTLSELYDKIGDYQKAYQSLVKLNQLNEEIQEEETQKRIEEFQVQYKTEQKDKEIANLAKQKQLEQDAYKSLKAQKDAEDSKNAIVNWALIGGVILLGLIGVLLFAAYRRRERINQFLQTNNENLKLKNAQIKSQSKQIEDSIAYARNIQNAILPLKSEMNGSLTSHFVYYMPKDIVSGDFYWYHELPDLKRALIAVADCTGHGVPGAFMSIVGHALLEKIVKQLGIYDTNLILDQLGFELNNTLQKGGDSDVKDGMDIALISIDLENCVVDYSGARNQLVFISSEGLKEYKGDRIDLGKGGKGDKKFTKHIIPFSSGDAIYMFTDGYVDQKGGENGKKFFLPPFRELIKEVASLPTEEQREIMDKKFKEWKGEKYEQMDDVLVMGITL